MVLWLLIPFSRDSCELKTNGVSQVFQILKKVPLPDRGNKTYSDNGGGGYRNTFLIIRQTKDLTFNQLINSWNKFNI